MIDYIKGELAELTPAQAVVEAYGVGYALNISLNTYEAVQGKKDVKLYVHESLVTGGRDDSYTFFGFASSRSATSIVCSSQYRAWGANTARMILCGFSCRACRSHFVRQRATAEGREGHRSEDGTAHHRGPEGQDHVAGHRPGSFLPAPLPTAPSPQTSGDEAVAALTMLGFSPAPTAKVVTALLTDNPTLPVEQVVKMALKQIK